MNQGEKLLENLAFYLFFLVFLNMMLLVDQSKMAWPIIILVLFGVWVASLWFDKGELAQKLEVFMEKRALLPLHLWLWVIAGYYVIVWTLDLFMDF